MTVTDCFPDIEEATFARQRRCIVTGDVVSEAELVRFVASPNREVTPDLAAKLPGRGLWVRAQREILDRAVARGQFSRAAKEQLTAASDLADRVEMLLVARMSGDLGLARRSGFIVMGFDNVARALDEKKPPVALVEASDAAPDGRRKLLGTALARGLSPYMIDCLTNGELSLALGRENVVHGALKSGRLSERLMVDAGRLRGFRPASQSVGLRSKADAAPAPNKGRE